MIDFELFLAKSKIELEKDIKNDDLENEYIESKEQ